MTCAHCERPVHARKMCQAHYKRWSRYGDPFHKRRQRGILDAPVVYPLGPARLHIVRTLVENPGIAFPWYALGSGNSAVKRSIRRLRDDYGDDVILATKKHGYFMTPKTASQILRCL